MTDSGVSGRALISAGSAQAAQAGAEVLAGGGNAVDAAIAASAVQCVRELPWCGVGGDAFAMVSDADGEVVALNGAGAVPRALASAEIPGGVVPRFGPLSISVPGLVDAWWRLWQRYGTRSFGSLMEPAAGLAEDGFALDGAFAAALHRVQAAVGAGDPLVAEFCDGNGSTPGERFALPGLARTLREVGAGGPSTFYRGRLAAAMAATVGELGGVLSTDDLDQHSCEVEAPVTITYRGAEVSVTPPPSMGWVMLQMLMLYERLDGPLIAEEADRIDLMVRCKHAAFCDLAGLSEWQCTADVAAVLGEDSLQRWAEAIGAQRRTASVPAPAVASATGTDTTCLAVVDEQGLMVSFVHSLFNEFGSRVVVPGTGIVFNDRMANQSAGLGRGAGSGRPRRALHTLVGYHIASGGRRLVGATPGGRGQVQTNFQVLRSIIDDDAAPQTAVDRPRWLSGAPRLPNAQDLLFLEPDFGPAVASELARRGHKLAGADAPAESDLFGSCTIAGVNTRSGETLGAADHRRSATLSVARKHLESPQEG